MINTGLVDLKKKTKWKLKLKIKISRSANFNVSIHWNKVKKQTTVLFWKSCIFHKHVFFTMTNKKNAFENGFKFQ